MNEIEIKQVLLQTTNHKIPPLVWKKKTRENVMFFVRTHIPVFSTHRQFNLKIVVAIASFILVLVVSIPITDALAAQSKPGDKLYSVGKFFEKAKLALASDSKKKILIKEQLEKRVDEFEYVVAEKDAEFEKDSAQELILHTQDVINNERFTLEEKRQIANDVQDRLEQIEKNNNKDSVAKSIKDVKSVLSQTEVKIEHKNAESTDTDNQNTGVGGMDEEDSQRIPVELKKIEEPVTSY